MTRLGTMKLRPGPSWTRYPPPPRHSPVQRGVHEHGDRGPVHQKALPFGSAPHGGGRMNAYNAEYALKYRSLHSDYSLRIIPTRAPDTIKSMVGNFLKYTNEI
jgi:hypothetical protein